MRLEEGRPHRLPFMLPKGCRVGRWGFSGVPAVARLLPEVDGTKRFVLPFCEWCYAMADVVRFGVSLPQQLVKAFDERIRGKGYRTRSEAIRDIMRESIIAAEWEGEEGEVVGTVTILYDHHTRELSNVLTSLQHTHHNAIACTTHVHLDEHNCLEVIVLKGCAQEIKTFADKLISTRGVKHGKLVCTSTGRKLA